MQPSEVAAFVNSLRAAFSELEVGDVEFITNMKNVMANLTGVLCGVGHASIH